MRRKTEHFLVFRSSGMWHGVTWPGGFPTFQQDPSPSTLGVNSWGRRLHCPSKCYFGNQLPKCTASLPTTSRNYDGLTTGSSSALRSKVTAWSLGLGFRFRGGLCWSFPATEDFHTGKLVWRWKLNNNNNNNNNNVSDFRPKSIKQAQIIMIPKPYRCHFLPTHQPTAHNLKNIRKSYT